MTYAIMMTCINVAEFVLISSLEKDHSMIETRRLKNFCCQEKLCCQEKFKVAFGSFFIDILSVWYFSIIFMCLGSG